ncbi:MAG: aspartyl-tRNA(Asn)/glutamyl-tRNA(Gln) amidotransferase subunit B [Cognaticolwellia sp.]|jgi:aspartyl-tRNA(Asn)/glutamyl-tRNA(Gln) amidotransferase subunit B
MDIKDKYESVIGLEVHIQLNTKSKAFCADNATFGGKPNAHTSPISLAHPGTLPRINKRLMESAVKLGLALGCEINKVNFFDRKNYFYADLPKGYQITQDSEPICLGGSVKVEMENRQRTVRLHHIHLEEDAGKSIHDLDEHFTLIDLNRAGVPLLEIVSEPDLRSADETAVFINELRKLVRYLDISDGNMEEGSMRFDCNISIRLKGETAYGNRCEVKNVNSIRNAKRAINHEIQRQIKKVEKGEIIVQETRGFYADKGTTYSLRSKEDAPDYRYFPEPDLPPIILSDDYILKVQKSMPTLPNVLKKQLMERYQLSNYDASVLTEERAMADYYLAVIEYTNNYKSAANWLINSIKGYLNDNNLSFDKLELKSKSIADLIALIDDGKVNILTAKQQLLPAMLKSPSKSPAELAKKLNLIQDSSDDFIDKILDDVIAKYPDKFEALKKGKKKLMGLFMGEVMKEAKGKANPKMVTDLIMKKLKS